MINMKAFIILRKNPELKVYILEIPKNLKNLIYPNPR